MALRKIDNEETNYDDNEVSILVLLDGSKKVWDGYGSASIANVSILVLLDGSKKVLLILAANFSYCVSILVLLDGSKKVCYGSYPDLWIEGFNPCSVGWL